VTTLARLTAVPQRIIAGDSVEMTLSDSDFAASDGGVLTFALAGSTALSVTGVVNGDAWDVTVTAAQTANLAAGNYQYRVRIVEGALSKTITTGTWTVDDLSDVSDLTYWQEIKAACRVARTSILSGEAKMMMIAGRQMMFHSLEEVDAMEARADAQISRLENGGRLPGILIGRYSRGEPGGWQ
jgi:hypothetical protein